MEVVAMIGAPSNRPEKLECPDTRYHYDSNTVGHMKNLEGGCTIIKTSMPI